MAGRGVLAACIRSLEGPGGSDMQGRGPRLRVGLLGLELESTMQSLHEPQLELAGRCNWLWRDGSRPGEVGY